MMNTEKPKKTKTTSQRLKRVNIINTVSYGPTSQHDKQAD